MTRPASDSAGVPWEGRTLSQPAFAGDDGSTDPGLAAVLAAHGRGETALPDVVAALASRRVLVPVVAALAEAEPVPGPVSGAARELVADKSADMALVTLRGADGRVALPVFSGTETLTRWDAGARPVPVDCRRAALSAVEEGAELLVLDVAGPVTVVVPRPAVWAVAQGRSWVPSPQDPHVVTAVERAATAEPDVVGVRCEPGERAELRVVLALRPGLDRAGLDAVTSAVARRLAEEETVAERVDSMEMRVTSS